MHSKNCNTTRCVTIEKIVFCVFPARYLRAFYVSTEKHTKINVGIENDSCCLITMSKSRCYIPSPPTTYHPLRAFPMMSSSDPTDSGNDSDVQIIAPSWDATAKGSSHYRVAFAILKGRSHGSPTLDTQRNHLKSFMGQPGGDYFTGQRVTQFNEVVNQLKVTWSKTASTLNKNWNGTYAAEKLALILCLIDEAMGEAWAKVKNLH